MYNKNAWEKYSEEEFKLVMKFNDDYKDFLSKGKTERKCVELSVKEAEANGFKELSTYSSLKKGDKVYVTNKNKNFAAFVIGEESIENGLRVLGAHIDSPRLDIKQNPLYEKNGFTLLDTHYYGGVKKYQWVTIPLALYGVVCKKDGTTINVEIGDDVNDYDSLLQADFAITVPNAVEKIKNIPNIQITERTGGDGAFREVVDALIY